MNQFLKEEQIESIKSCARIHDYMFKNNVLSDETPDAVLKSLISDLLLSAGLLSEELKHREFNDAIIEGGIFNGLDPKTKEKHRKAIKELGSETIIYRKKTWKGNKL